VQIPEHWAEARVVGKVNGRDRVVRRFGWSATGADDAMALAQQRAQQALAELQQGRAVAPREQKLPYGGHGMPIREQVLARRGDLVITRNSYGAHCLNVPAVLFADVDYEPRLSDLAEFLFVAGSKWLAAIAVATALALFMFGNRLGCAALLAAVVVPTALLVLREKLRHGERTLASSRRRARERIERVAAAVPRGRFALYETPVGLRLIALHATYDPTAAATQQLLRELGTDPAFAQMCELQACFRARTSGKPWRMGVRQIRPRPGIWPVHPDRRALREEWIAEYEAVAGNFAACRHLADLGDGTLDTRCAEVQRVHDELSRARTDLPLA
jgi:hypothetical protein